MSAAGRAPPAATDDGAALRLLWRAWWVCNLLTLFVRSFLGAVCGFAISLSQRHIRTLVPPFTRHRERGLLCIGRLSIS